PRSAGHGAAPHRFADTALLTALRCLVPGRPHRRHVGAARAEIDGSADIDHPCLAGLDDPATNCAVHTVRCAEDPARHGSLLPCPFERFAVLAGPTLDNVRRPPGQEAALRRTTA